MLRSAMKRFLCYKRILFAGAFMFLRTLRREAVAGTVTWPLGESEFNPLQSIKEKIKPNTSVELTIFLFRKCEPATLSKKSLPDKPSLP